MPVPWVRLLDAAINVIGISGVTDLARRRTRPADEERERTSPAGGVSGMLEARLAGVVVAALKEAFDRDSRRVDFEREQAEAEHQRAERALRMELMRQAGDREIGRLRLVAGMAVVSWMATLFLAGRLMGGGVGARIWLGSGWALLLTALAAAFAAQSRVAAALSRIDTAGDAPTVSRSGVSGALAPWLIVLGLALVGVAVLVA